MNHSFDYLDRLGPEPAVSDDYSNLHRWDAWMAWSARVDRAKHAVAHRHPHAVLRSQRTRACREEHGLAAEFKMAAPAFRRVLARRPAFLSGRQRLVLPSTGILAAQPPVR